MVVNGIVERLLAMPAGKRPRFYLFGESLGSQVSEEMFVGTGMTGPGGVGLDAAVWIGTPAAASWRKELWGIRTVAKGTRWMPVTTFFMTFLDMQNALVPAPGIFDEGGHDYRREIPEAIRTVWGLKVSDEQMERVKQALRERELVWAVKRGWKSAELKPTPERPAAEQALAEKISVWSGRTIDVDGMRAIAEGEVSRNTSVTASPLRPRSDRDEAGSRSRRYPAR